MRIGLHCHDCIMEGLADNEPDQFSPFSDSGLYEFDCKNGHHVVAVVQQTRFEVLAEVGVQAIVDGYYREAITSFNASFERFMQFYVEAVFVERQERGDLIANTWKLADKQSERQLGMFLATYLFEMGEIPPTLPQQSRHDAGSVEFRNSVVHRGQIPTENEAIEFAQKIINLVQPVLNIMASRYSEAISAIVNIHQAQARAKVGNRQKVSFIYYPMVYRVIGDAPPGGLLDQEPMNVKAEVSRRKERRLG